ncbi:MAG TPA: hypothetical protein VHM89_12900 [Acidimicrobiales bacterium]|nr:hypothetical protein [Acidimicrobiales bacterium]
MGLSLLNDPRAFLGTDTGGKVATLRVMTERGHLDPDIGYWAERWDPTGRVHPLYYTSHFGHRWVNATTLPVLYAAYPLYALGGYRLTLALPMLGSVLSALAARALARLLTSGPSDGWAAFWIVGLASPLTIYALDFWEHSLGVAAMAWAIVLLVDAVEARRGWPAFLGAGALFGAAATMRTEALVYGFVAVGGACLVLSVRRRPGLAVGGGALAAVGLAVPLLANSALEVATVGETIRFSRAAGSASGAIAGVGGASGVAGTRLQEALLNAAALTPSLEPLPSLIGFGVLGLLAFVAWRASRSGDVGPAVLAAAGVGALYLIRFAEGPGFVPGLVATTPLAAVGLVLGWRTAAGRFVCAVALVALPLVWASQFSGGAAPQWAGRYLLVSGLLLGVAGIAGLERLRPWARASVVGLAGVVTAFGMVWMSIRTHDFAHALAALNRRPEPVLVSRIGHLAREGGVFYGDHRWLSATNPADQRFAVHVLEEAGIRRFGLIEATDFRQDSPIAGWRQVGTDELELVDGLQLTVTTFEAD